MSNVTQQAQSKAPEILEPIDVDAVLAEFGGDARAAIVALLHDLEALALDAEACASRGYVRSRTFKRRVTTCLPQSLFSQKR